MSLPPSSLLDCAWLVDVLRVEPFDVVFQLAALGRPTPPPTNSALELLVIGTANLFDAIRLAGIDPRVVIGSTEAVFGAEGDISQAPSTAVGVAEAGQALLVRHFENRGAKAHLLQVAAEAAPAAVAAKAWAMGA